MKVGVISDTHDNLDAIKKALEVFREKGVEFILHAGDIVAPFSLVPFKEYSGRFVGVFGNNEGEVLLLRERARELGLKLSGWFEEVVLDGKRIALYHGTYKTIVEALVKSQMFDVVVYGHTHMVHVAREGRTLVINPGEACGYVTGKRTVAVLDTGKMEVEVIQL